VPRDKGQGQTKRAEIQRVFHGANQKSFKVKNKAKPVTTNLKTRKSCPENEPVNADEATRFVAQL
uniref:Uncharacterized protein n=2 Tax=Sus scrofa TaxID=9823 RepID=A0A4X1VW89_PIG